MEAIRPKRRPSDWYGPIFAILPCLFLWAALLTFHPEDWPSAEQYPHPDQALNACGRTGAWFAYQLFVYLGNGVYPLMLFLTLAEGLWLAQGRIRAFWQRVVGLGLVVVCTSAAAHLVAPGGADALSVGNGGVLGMAAGDFLYRHFKGVGTVIVLTYSLVVGLLFVAEGWILSLPSRIKGAVGRSREGAAVTGERTKTPATPSSPIGPALTPSLATATTGVVQTVPADIPRINPGRSNGGEKTAEGSTGKRRAAPSAPSETPVSAPEKVVGDKGPPEPVPAPPAEVPVVLTDLPASPRVVSREEAGHDHVKDSTDGRNTARVNSVESGEGSGDVNGSLKPGSGVAVSMPVKTTPPAPPKPYPGELGEWELPPLSLFREPEYGLTSQQEAHVRKQAAVLGQTLLDFRVQARVVEVDTGPVISLYELEVAPGVKVSQIVSLSNDIARSLKAPAVRVVAPIPGKNTIGIEVPNTFKERVRIRELVNLGGESVKKMQLPLFLGKDASGNALITDLTKMPHLLIAGTTGSGKSVCMNSIIISLLALQRPDRVKLILVDPKMVEMNAFKRAPHLMCPIITDLERVESILDWAATKMDERYELLSEAGVRDITGYNSLGTDEIMRRFEPTSEAEAAGIPKHLPYIIIMIDELADLMMTAGKQVEYYLSRLAQKSRAVGIHIVVATQRPEAKVVTGLIKSNLPCRIAFRVASRLDSRIVLDQNGAETLMGQGDMLFLPPGSAKLIRAQGAYIDDYEIHKVTEFLTEQGEPEFHPELVKLRTKELSSGARDPLFNEAARIIIESGRGSVSLLQRRLTVGYSRASRLVEQLAEGGIVGDYKGTQSREVLMTMDEWEEYLAGSASSGPTENLTELLGEPAPRFADESQRAEDAAEFDGNPEEEENELDAGAHAEDDDVTDEIGDANLDDASRSVVEAPRWYDPIKPASRQGTDAVAE